MAAARAYPRGCCGDVDISCGIGIGIEMTLTQHSMRTLATSLPAPCSNKLIFDRHFTFTHAIAMELTHSRETAQLLLKKGTHMMEAT